MKKRTRERMGEDETSDFCFCTAGGSRECKHTIVSIATITALVMSDYGFVDAKRGFCDDLEAPYTAVLRF